MCHFGPLILHMSSGSEALLDHIADFLKFISSTQLFWFLLITSYNHGCHLANRFRLDPDEYKALLIMTGLVHYTRFGFEMKPPAWSILLVLRGWGDKNITISHRCGGGDCGGSGNSNDNTSNSGGGSSSGGDGGDGGNGGSRESDIGIVGSRGNDSDEQQRRRGRGRRRRR